LSFLKPFGERPNYGAEIGSNSGCLAERSQYLLWEAKEEPELTPSERRALERGLARSEKEYKAGLAVGRSIPTRSSWRPFTLRRRPVAEKQRGGDETRVHAPLSASIQKSSCEIQRAFNKQALLLLQDLRHPSLRAKKFDEARDIWQGRVN
jgi:hypothetical protein